MFKGFGILGYLLWLFLSIVEILNFVNDQIFTVYCIEKRTVKKKESGIGPFRKSIFKSWGSDLILDGLITNFQPDEMFKRLEESLVEVEVDELGGVLQEGGDNAVEIGHRPLGDVKRGMAGSLKLQI